MVSSLMSKEADRLATSYYKKFIEDRRQKHAKVMVITDRDECGFCEDLSCLADMVHFLCECDRLVRSSGPKTSSPSY